MFRRDVGHPPARFVEAARLDAARRMLVDSPTPLQRIAYFCGFGDASTMRRAFVRNLGINPVDYRKRFRTTAAA
ncbi:helix-turn-helix domain-containing protein [Azospirillum sp. YIM B02556]|uniref:Helix-turn-helix domain-containing protein n=1 Tax=Azospirillum endophyticum TaxID=2800326 RepID=A0ABS1FHH7_9PROT|nr:helix-turn-helix domain-containing protein [Azospirillum endophyticum]